MIKTTAVAAVQVELEPQIVYKDVIKEVEKIVVQPKEVIKEIGRLKKYQ